MKYTDIGTSIIPYKKLGIIGGAVCVLLTAAVLIMLTGQNRAVNKIGFDRINYTVTFEMNGESVTYGSGTSEDIAALGGEIGQFAKDFYALNLTEVSDDPVENLQHSAKFYFGNMEMTLCRGEDISGKTVCTLTLFKIKPEEKKIFLISEKQCQRLFDDIADMFDYEDALAQYDAAAVEDIINGKYFKIERVYHGLNYDSTTLFSEEGRAELIEWLRSIKYTPLDKNGLTMSEGDELYFYDESGMKALRKLTAKTAEHRYIDCVLVGDYLYRIDNTGNYNRILWFCGERILAAEYTLLNEEKFDGFTLTLGDKSAEYAQGAMESRTGQEGVLHTLKYNINKASGALCDIEGEQTEAMRLDCKTGDKTDSIILTSAPYGVHTRYFMTVMVNAEHTGVDVGTYCYELTEEDYMKIMNSAEVLLK